MRIMYRLSIDPKGHKHMQTLETGEVWLSRVSTCANILTRVGAGVGWAVGAGVGARVGAGVGGCSKSRSDKASIFILLNQLAQITFQ